MPHLVLVLGLVCKLPSKPTELFIFLEFTRYVRVTREYDFFNFNSFQGNNDSINVILYLSPSLNSNTDAQPLAYSIQVDSQAPITVVPVGPEKPGGLPDGWDGLDGWVANFIITVPTTFKGISRGNHTLKVSHEFFVCPSPSKKSFLLKISMMQPALVIQKIVIGGLPVSSSPADCN